METKANEPLNTDENGRDEQGRFLSGNNGRPKGATNKTTRDLRRFITNFLNEKAAEIPDLWETLDNKDKLSLFMHLSRLVLPKANEDEPENPNQLKQPVWIVADNSNKDTNIKPIDWVTGMEIIDSGTPQITPEQIDKNIDKL